MSRKVFLDTNIILDFLLLRSPFMEEAREIFYKKEEGEVELYVSALSFGIASYFIEKSKNNSSQLIAKLLQLVEVVDLTRDIIEQAVVSNFQDFEDALQYCSAKSVSGIEVLVTRNKKDFKHSSILIFTPAEFINSAQ